MRSYVAVLAAALLLASGVAQADTLQLNPAADTSLYRESDDTADGAGPHLWVGNTAGGDLRRALLRFDLGSLPAGHVITGAELGLFMSRTRAPGLDVSVHRLSASWAEGTSNGGSGGAGDIATPGEATWGYRFHNTTAWSQAGADFVTAASATTNVGFEGALYSWASPGLLADVQGWYANPSGNFGWALLGDERDMVTAMRFDSRDNASLSNRPYLMLTLAPVPEPSMWVMMAMGLALLGFAARRSKTA